MTAQLYSGTFDWEKIYSAFHSPIRIAERISCELDGNNHPLIFSGFAETAAHLASQMPVTFIDLSPSVATCASERYSGLNAVRTGDVTQFISSSSADTVVIVCRISAYWGGEEFDRLAKSLRKFPRRQIIIDFFDRDVVEPGQTISFESSEGNGKWIYLDFKESEGSAPPISKARLDISYSLQDDSVSYEGYRSFFRKVDIEQWCKRTLPEYRVKICAALMDSDPSFTLKLTSRPSLSEQFGVVSTNSRPIIRSRSKKPR